MKRTSNLVALLAVIALLLAACGSDEDNGDSSPTTDAPTATSDGDQTDGGAASFPVTVSGANGEITLDAEPQRIVSLAPALTETIYGVGAGDQVVAVDDMSNFPEDAPVTELSGYEPNVEAIGGYEPDLVIASGDPGDLVSGLELIGVPTLILPAVDDLEGVYAQIEVVGDATGHSDEADDLVDEMKSRIKELEAEVPEGDPVTYFHELDDMLYTVTSETFIGQLYTMAGFSNIADEADPDGTGYPQLSAEFLIQEDPQAIFLADTKCCGQDAAAVAGRPGWENLQAVTGGHVFELDDDIASRWGPRVVDFVETLVEARTTVASGS